MSRQDDGGALVNLLLFAAAEFDFHQAPARLRVEALLGGGGRRTAPLNLFGTVVVPITSGRSLRPYAVAGAGVYGVGGVKPRAGVTAGAGLEFAALRLPLFAELWAHSERNPTVTAGLRF